MKISKKNPPKFCLTAAGFLVHEGKVLLVKHKKLGIWLAPGGHVDSGEQTYYAAEREFWEETGVKVKAIDFLGTTEYFKSKKSEYLPRPFSVNLHWISQKNYKQRLSSSTPNQVVTDNPKWKLGCEKHVSYVYLVKPVEGVEYRKNTEETDGIAWFAPDEIQDLETRGNIKNEAMLAFKYATALEGKKINKGK